MPRKRLTRSTSPFPTITIAHLKHGGCLISGAFCEICYGGLGPAGQEWGDRPNIDKKAIWQRHRAAVLKEWQEDPRSDGGKVPCWGEKMFDEAADAG